MNDIASPTIAEQTSIGSLLGRVKMAISAAVDDALQRDAELAPLEVTAAQFSILAQLHQGETACAGDLCKNMTYDRGAMSRMLDRLENKGLIRRVRRAGERRTISLEVTELGLELLPKMRACVDAVVQGFLRDIAPDDIARAESVLLKMLHNAKS